MSEEQYWDMATDEPLSDSDLHERYDDMLDELSTVEIGSLTYQGSRVLREVDPIAYRVGFSDWLDSELGETITDEDPNPEPTEPGEDDITTEDDRNFYQYGKLVFTLSEDEDVNKGIADRLDQIKFWPDVWFISDHGNAHLIHYWED